MNALARSISLRYCVVRPLPDAPAISQAGAIEGHQGLPNGFRRSSQVKLDGSELLLPRFTTKDGSACAFEIGNVTTFENKK